MAAGAREAESSESKNWSTERWESGDPSGSRLKIPKSPETLNPGAGLQGTENRRSGGRGGAARLRGWGWRGWDEDGAGCD